MSTNIRNTISFGTYKAVIDKVIGDTFMDGVYTPENEDVSIRVAMLSAFAPDFVLDEDDSDKMWEQAYSDEANEILDSLYKNRQYIALQRTIDKTIQHRLQVLETGSMSLTDYALSQFVKTLDEKVKGLDITDEGVKAVTEAVGKSNDKDFANNLVDVFLRKGLLDNKPNRATRRANGQTSKSKTIKKSKKEPIELDIETKD